MLRRAQSFIGLTAIWLVAVGMLIVGSGRAAATPQVISIRWATDAPSGEIAVVRGQLVQLTASGGTARSPQFSFPPHEPGSLQVTVEGERDQPLPTLVTLTNSRRTFTFGVSDIDAAHPIYLPSDQVIVTTAADPRSFDESWSPCATDIPYRNSATSRPPPRKLSPRPVRTCATSNRKRGSGSGVTFGRSASTRISTGFNPVWPAAS